MTSPGCKTALGSDFEPSSDKRLEEDGRSHCIHLICQSVSGFVRQIHCALATYVLKATQVHRTGNKRWRRGTGHAGRSRGAGREAAAFLERLVFVAIVAPGVLVLHNMFAGEGVDGIGCVGGAWGGAIIQFRAVISASLECITGLAYLGRVTCTIYCYCTVGTPISAQLGGAKQMTTHTFAYCWCVYGTTFTWLSFL